MLAFADNSVLCRLALAQSAIDAVSFTGTRLLAGALVLWLLARAKARHAPRQGSWLSAAMLFLYAAVFGYAYLSLPAGTGALLLFGAVQTTMLGWAMYSCERLQALQLCGLVAARADYVGSGRAGPKPNNWSRCAQPTRPTP